MRARYALQNTDGRFWNFTAWRDAQPERLMTGPEADAAVASMSRPVVIVDVLVLRARQDVWFAAHQASLRAAGYDTCRNPDVRAEMVEAAREAGNRAAAAAGYRRV